ncbi:MAG: S41 family peptidase [Bauldia sp.]
MIPRSLARAAPFFVLLWFGSAVAAPDVPPSGNAVIDRTVQIVDQNFYSQAALPAFHDAVKAVVAGAGGQPLVTADAESRILASLGASHTGRYTPDQLDYYELADVFRYALHDNIRTLFPPDGKIAYDGIGIASKEIGGARFITDVYDGGPAERAGLTAGDEIVSADGKPFTEIGSFKGKAGGSVDLQIRRHAGDTPTTVTVGVETIEPQQMFVEAVDKSAHVIQQDGRKIGVLHLWTYTTDRITGVIFQDLATKLKDVDGLVLDLRSRWGGGPADGAEPFVSATADMQVIDHDGDTHYVYTGFHKPIVAIIDDGTRSSMEILAYSLKKAGIPLVGEPTAGDVLAATAYALPDDSLLELAVQDVIVDGKRLEKNPVTPDVAVPFDVRYAAGSDPQMDKAVALLGQRLATSVN